MIRFWLKPNPDIRTETSFSFALIASLFALAIVPLAGLFFNATLMRVPLFSVVLDPFGVPLTSIAPWTFRIAWVGFIAGIPTALVLNRYNLSGWSTIAAAGSLIGAVIFPIFQPQGINGLFSLTDLILLSAAFGVIYALVAWIINTHFIRLMIKP